MTLDIVKLEGDLFGKGFSFFSLDFMTFETSIVDEDFFGKDFL